MPETAGAGTNTLGTTVASVSFNAKRDSDLIDDALMSEVAERLRVFIEDDPTPAVYRGVNPPADTSLIWQPIDESGVNVGPIHIYNPETGLWEPSGGETEPVAPVVPLIAGGVLIFSAAENQEVTLPDEFLTIEPGKIGVGTCPVGDHGFLIHIDSIDNTKIVFTSTGQGSFRYTITGQVL